MSETYRNFDHSRRTAIKEHCLECSGYSPSERKRCQAVGCALWAFRNGYEVDENNQRIKNPNMSGRTFPFQHKNESETDEINDDFEPEIDSDDEDE